MYLFENFHRKHWSMPQRSCSAVRFSHIRYVIGGVMAWQPGGNECAIIPMVKQSRITTANMSS